ncbi:MAG: glycerophosphodiester phosphodiesterase [Gammaproteobacteria bacterium]
MKFKVLLPVFALLITGGVAAWYQGWLANLYASYPDRVPLITREPWQPIKVIAHRGDAKALPENTLISFQAAIDKGMDFLELDIKLTKDGVPVVLHDASVERTTDGVGNVASLTFKELQQLDAGSWFSPEYAGQQVPSLQQVIDLAIDRTCVYIDMKVMPDYRLVRELRRHSENFSHGCFLISIAEPFNKDGFDLDFAAGGVEQKKKFEKMVSDTIKRHERQYQIFQRYWPDFPYAGKYKWQSPDVGQLLETYPGLVAVEVFYVAVNRELVEKLHQRGLLVYTRVPFPEENYDPVRQNKIYKQLMESGLDIIFPDDPNGFRQFQQAYISGVKN